jgi:hypothetical protein
MPAPPSLRPQPSARRLIPRRSRALTVLPPPLHVYAAPRPPRARRVLRAPPPPPPCPVLTGHASSLTRTNRTRRVHCPHFSTTIHPPRPSPPPRLSTPAPLLRPNTRTPAYAPLPGAPLPRRAPRAALTATHAPPGPASRAGLLDRADALDHAHVTPRPLPPSCPLHFAPRAHRAELVPGLFPETLQVYFRRPCLLFPLC